MKVLLFGVTRDICGSPFLSIEKSEDQELPQTVGALRKQVNEHYPQLAKLSSLAIAVNNSYAEDTLEINQNDEIALIPPVSGG